MDKNYYQTLGIKRNSTQQQIADSYRRLALVWHPNNSKQNKQTSSHHFAQVCQAYDVLHDPVKRAYYDKHGWRKLTCELYKDAGLKGGYKFGNNSQEIFERFFSSTSALNQVLDQGIHNKGSMFSHAFGGLYYKDQIQRPDLVYSVPCTLNQLYKGAAKNVSFFKKALNPDGRTISQQIVTKLLQIKPGYGKSTVLRFKQQGNQTIQRKHSDLVFNIVQSPNQLYRRSGNDLIYTAKINLIQAFNCTPLQIITLDDRKLRVGLDQIPNPHTMKQIEGQGMPIQGKNKKGNLYIKFDIIFPKNLTEQIRSQLRKLLK